MSKELIELSNALAQTTDRAAAGVVAIHTERRGSSSGVVWRRGVIVTSEHALRRDEEIHGPARLRLDIRTNPDEWRAWHADERRWRFELRDG